jgi:hypothetical protein
MKNYLIFTNTLGLFMFLFFYDMNSHHISFDIKSIRDSRYTKATQMKIVARNTIMIKIDEIEDEEVQCKGTETKSFSSDQDHKKKSRSRDAIPLHPSSNEKGMFQRRR